MGAQVGQPRCFEDGMAAMLAHALQCFVRRALGVAIVNENGAAAERYAPLCYLGDERFRGRAAFDDTADWRTGEYVGNRLRVSTGSVASTNRKVSASASLIESLADTVSTRRSCQPVARRWY